MSSVGRSTARYSDRIADARLDADVGACAEVLAGGAVAGTVGASAAALGAPRAAQAVVRVADPAGGGGTVTAYELPVELNVLALSGSLPSNWVPQFRTTQANTARVHIQQRQQVRPVCHVRRGHPVRRWLQVGGE
jgi:hypothetical protein